MKRLQDICTDIVDCHHTTACPESTGYPLIRTPNIGRGRLILDNVQRVSEKVYLLRCSRCIPRDNDLIFAREALPGNVAIIKNGEKVCLGQRTVLLRPDTHQVDPDFLVYFLLAPLQQYNLLGTANGATVKHINVPAIRNLSINLPPLARQKKIGAIISSYDDAIESNRKQIKLLEEAAERLYREWFTEGAQQKEWKTQRADGVCSITIGKTPPRKEPKWFSTELKDMPWVSIADMGSGNVFIEKTSEYLTSEAINRFHVSVVPPKTVLLSFKLTVGRVCISACNLTTNEAIAHFKTENEALSYYLYFYLKAFPFSNLGSTSAIGTAINSKVVKAMPIILPPEALLEHFHSFIAPSMNDMLDLQRQNRVLAAERDGLLPKLMSGEMEVAP